MPAAFPPCVGRGIPDAPLLPRSGRPAPPPFFPVQAGLSLIHIFFGAGLVTPAVLVSRGISFYSFLLLSGCVTLLVHLRTRNRQPVAVSPRLPKTARGTVVT